MIDSKLIEKMNIDQNKREILNGKILSLFLFQYTISILAFNYINKAVVIGTFSLILLTVLMISNHFRGLNAKVIFTFIVLFVILSLKLFQGTSIQFIFDLLVFAGTPAIAFSFRFNYREFLLFSLRLSMINFIFVIPYPIFFRYNYMRLGYALLPSAVFLTIKIGSFWKNEVFKLWWERNRLLDVVVLIICLFMMIFMGNRGALFAYVLFLVVYLFVFNRTHIVRNIALIIGAAVIYVNGVPILNFMYRLSNKYGLFGRNIKQFIVQLEEGFSAASAGRNRIYEQAYNNFLAHPVLGGTINPDAGEYAHNIFLEVLQDTGIIGFLILLFFLIIVLVRIISKKWDDNYRLILCSLFSLSLGRLMFSSTLWQRPEFWILVFVVISGTHFVDKPTENVAGNVSDNYNRYANAPDFHQNI